MDTYRHASHGFQDRKLSHFVHGNIRQALLQEDGLMSTLMIGDGDLRLNKF